MRAKTTFAGLILLTILMTSMIGCAGNRRVMMPVPEVPEAPEIRFVRQSPPSSDVCLSLADAKGLLLYIESLTTELTKAQTTILIFNEK